MSTRRRLSAPLIPADQIAPDVVDLDPTPLPEWKKPVIAVPLSQAFPTFDEVKEFRSKVCLFNHDRTTLFDVVSPKYQVVQHSDAIGRITSGLAEYFGTNVEPSVRSLKQGAIISAEFKLPVDPIKIRGGRDANEITINVRNSYDRSEPFSATLGAFRLICSNGAKIGETFGSINARHVGADGSDYILNALSLMVERAPKLKDLWSEWDDTKLSYEEAVDMVDGLFPMKYLEPVLDESRFKGGRSKWDFYNDLTRFATHDTTSVRRRMQFDDIIANIFYPEE